MQDEQYQAYNQGNVNETSGYAKREISKQPKNDQNRGDYPKHIFISRRLDASAVVTLDAQGKHICPVVDTFIF